MLKVGTPPAVVGGVSLTYSKSSKEISIAYSHALAVVVVEAPPDSEMRST